MNVVMNQCRRITMLFN